jgi:nucleotide-binding universal stress UspA family protein
MSPCVSGASIETTQIEGALLMQDIIVGVDPSETARLAATKAAELAAALGANLHLVTCAERSRSVDIKVGTDEFHGDWLSDAQQFLDQLGRQLPHDTITTSVASGDPAKALCEEAERLDARMIVVGNRRVQGASRVLGSIAAAVAKSSPCDVLIAHTVE